MNNSEIEVLLVEDNKGDATLTIMALKEHNLANKLIHLQDGAEAINYIFCTGEYKDRIIENHPKIILLDLKMPKVGGIEVLQKIKSDERTKTIPVIILTSSAEDPDVKRCYELGANSYLVKPVSFDDFKKVVTSLGMYWMILNTPCC